MTRKQYKLLVSLEHAEKREREAKARGDRQALKTWQRTRRELQKAYRDKSYFNSLME